MSRDQCLKSKGMADLNRQELNRRFKEVFSLLVERKEIIKSNRQKSKSVFAQKIGTKGHIIELFLRDERLITYEQAKLLCNEYGINEAYMFQGIGRPFSTQKLPDPEDKLCMALGIDFSPNILFTNVEGFASNTVGVDLWEANQRFSIPGITGDLVAFYINGDSMSPTISAGDMVICSPIETNKEIKEEEVYAVVSNTCVWVKRIQKCIDKYGRWTHLRLISDNHYEFDPFIIEVNEVRRILKVIKRVTGLS